MSTMTIRAKPLLLGMLMVPSAASIQAAQPDNEKLEFDKLGHAGCSQETLYGTYAFAYTGTDNGAPYTTSGRETYDGHGHIKYLQLVNDAGVSASYTGTGTYTVTADCLVKAIYGSETWTYFVGPDGSIFFYNNNNIDGLMDSGQEVRISHELLF